METDGYSRESVFADAVKARRLASGWTQTDLARHMKGKGFSFHQQTVQRIEDKTRPVRLDEAFALAEVLGQQVTNMTLDVSALKRVSAEDAMRGPLNLSTSLWRAWNDWAEDVGMLVSQVSYGCKDGRAGPAIWAGLELLRRQIVIFDEVGAAVAQKVKPYEDQFLPPVGNSGPDDDTPVDVVVARQLVEEHGTHIPKSYRRLSLAELVERFVGKD